MMNATANLNALKQYLDFYDKYLGGPASGQIQGGDTGMGGWMIGNGGSGEQRPGLLWAQQQMMQQPMGMDQIAGMFSGGGGARSRPAFTPSSYSQPDNPFMAKVMALQNGDNPVADQGQNYLTQVLSRQPRYAGSY